MDDGVADCRFNEGGADCPPKERRTHQLPIALPSFNEGGADCPPKVEFVSPPGIADTGFNEGGADCPPKGTASLQARAYDGTLQ